MQLAELVEDIANALAAVDASGAAHKQFKPGIGPFGEADAVRAALGWLKSSKPDAYRSAATKRLPDLLIPAEWAVELKVVRPFGENGLLAEHWSETFYIRILETPAHWATASSWPARSLPSVKPL